MILHTAAQVRVDRLHSLLKGVESALLELDKTELTTAVQLAVVDVEDEVLLLLMVL
jgi:hypothetical protein